VIDPIIYLWSPVVWRNHEASYDVAELEPGSRKTDTYVLQEYFVPVGRFDEFHPKMADILRRHRVNVMNISIRHAPRDPGTLMAWARWECFAFVLYYKQGTSAADRDEVRAWTRELIDAAASAGGSYYLPYQILATPEQFRRAYPRVGEFVALKERVDPGHKFRNKLWDAYDPVAGPAQAR
jgi:FAD/FMN-containing dehydrogenase